MLSYSLLYKGKRPNGRWEKEWNLKINRLRMLPAMRRAVMDTAGRYGSAVNPTVSAMLTAYADTALAPLNWTKNWMTSAKVVALMMGQFMLWNLVADDTGKNSRLISTSALDVDEYLLPFDWAVFFSFATASSKCRISDSTTAMWPFLSRLSDVLRTKRSRITYFKTWWQNNNKTNAN